MRKKDFFIFFLQIFFIVTLFEFIFPAVASALCLPTAISSNCESGTNCNNNLGSIDGNNPGYCDATFPGSCAEVIDAGGGFYQTVCFARVGVPSPTPGSGCGKLGFVCCLGPNYCDSGLEPTSTGGTGSCVCQNPTSPIPTRLPVPTGNLRYLPTAASAPQTTNGIKINFENLRKGVFTNPGVINLGGDLTIGDILSNALRYVYVIAGLVLLFMLISGGFQMIVGAGDAKAKEGAGKTITNAIVGFIILFVSYWIVQIVQVVLGISILK